MVGSQDDLFVIVADQCQWTHFTFEGLLRRHIRRYLIIGVLTLLFCDKIDLRVAQLTDHHLIAPSQQFKIDHVFNRKTEVIISARQNVISQTEIYDIELLVDLQKLLTHNVKALCGIEDKGLCQGIHIIIHRIGRHLSAGRNQIVCDATNRNRAAHHAGEVLCNGFQQRNICYLPLGWLTLLAGLPVFDVLHNDRVVDAL